VKAVKSAQLGKRLFSFFVLSTRYWSSTATSILRLPEELTCDHSEKDVSNFQRNKYYSLFREICFKFPAKQIL